MAKQPTTTNDIPVAPEFGLRFKRLHPDAVIPTRATPDAAGLDVYAWSLSESGRSNQIILAPKSTKLVRTCIAIEPPPGYAVFVLSRSGLAAKSIWVTNAPGLIDPDYRGEIGILLYNGGFEPAWITHHDRVAQLFVVPVVPMPLLEVEELTETSRGGAGFGSTGR